MRFFFVIALAAASAAASVSDSAGLFEDEVDATGATICANGAVAVDANVAGDAAVVWATRAEASVS